MIHMLTNAERVSVHPFLRTFTARCGHVVERTGEALPDEGFTTSSGRVTCPGCQWKP